MNTSWGPPARLCPRTRVPRQSTGPCPRMRQHLACSRVILCLSQRGKREGSRLVLLARGWWNMQVRISILQVEKMRLEGRRRKAPNTASLTGQGPSLLANCPGRLSPALATGWISQQQPIIYRPVRKHCVKVPVILKKVNIPFPCSSLPWNRGRVKLQRNLK